jgi:hypothetical protein
MAQGYGVADGPLARRLRSDTIFAGTRCAMITTLPTDKGQQGQERLPVSAAARVVLA